MSDGALRSAIAALALAGAGIAAYLTYARYADVRIACATGGCETVQQSSYAKVAGLPVAVLGLAAYVFLIATLLFTGPLAAALGAAVGLGGFAFSLYLLYAQLFDIEAVCQWCIANDVVIGLLAVATTARLLRAPPPEPVAG